MANIIKGLLPSGKAPSVLKEEIIEMVGEHAPAPDLSGYVTKEDLAQKSESLTILTDGQVVSSPAGSAPGQLVGYWVPSGEATANGEKLGVGAWIFGWDAAAETWVLLTKKPAVELDATNTTPPVAGTLSTTSVEDSVVKVIVSGASDDKALHESPYSFRANEGSWSPWSSSPTYAFSGLTPESSVELQHRVQDSGGNIAEGSPITVQTKAYIATVEATWRYSSFDNSSKQSYTFDAVPLGEASATRTALVAVGYRGTASQSSAPTVNVGGVNATMMKKPEDPRVPLSSTSTVSGSDVIFYTATVPTGSNGQVSVSFTAAPFRAGVQVWTFPIGVKPVSSTSANSWVSPASIGLLPTEKQAVVGAGLVSPTAMVSVDAEHTAAGSSNSIIGWEENGAAVTQEVTNGGPGGYVAAVWGGA